jgi:hypothetical protein
MKKLRIAAVLIAWAGSAWAQVAMKMVTPDQLVWKDHPVFKDVQFVVLIGDPAKAGDLYVLRAKYPPNYHIAPHTHLGDETPTVLTGSVGVGMGETFERKGEMLKADSVWMYPATTGDLRAIKTEIIAAVKNTVQGLATQETISAVMETVAETKESVTDIKGLMKEMI